MTRTLLTCIAGVVLLAGAGASYAHHSFTAAYDNTKRVEIEGVVREFMWRNPHSFVRIEVTTKEGATETFSAAKYPVTRTTLKAGDRIVVGGEPGRDPSARRIRIFSIKRPIDGWTWEGIVD
jgi:hypothetical protein